MLNFKRSLLVVVGLLCALCFAACGGAAKPTAGVAGQGDANSNAATVTVVPTAQPQKTAEAVKVQSQNQQQASQNQQGTQNQAQAANNGNQQAAQNNAQAANSGNQQAAQSNAQAGDQNMQQNPAPQNPAPQNNGGGSGTLVNSTQVNVNGQMMNVLTTGTGLALYYRTSDPAPGSTCTGDCAKAWPPFIAQGNVIPGDNFQGQLTVHATANGNQIEYNGHPLYTYSGDSAKGQLNGQGLNGVWNAATIIPPKQHW